MGAVPQRRLVIVGGDAAGMSAASQARRRKSPDELEIIAFERGPETSFSACGIPYWIGDLVADRDDLIARAPDEFRRRDIDVRVRSLVTDIDTTARTVTVRDLETGRTYTERYDDLLLATGSTPLRPDIPGLEVPDGADAGTLGVFSVHSLDDGARVRGAVERLGAGRSEPLRAVVLGAGYVGMETAEALLLRGAHVTVVDHSATPFNTLDHDMGEHLVEQLADATPELHLRLGQSVDRIERDESGHVTGVRTAEGQVIEADLVVLGLGVRPAVELARAAGVPIGTSGGIVVDRRMRTQVEGVWAAGDCVESHHRLSHRSQVIALGTHANKQGRVAGDNITGAYAAFHGVIGTAATRVCAVEVARTGLGVSEAERAGYSVVATAVDSTTRAGYLKDARPIRVKLVADRGTGRLLGGQIVGGEGSAKRIDVVALAIWNGMTAEELFTADLSYAPPVSPVYDPVVIAARKTHDAVLRDNLKTGGLD
jgi:NADPH-dependent 2,4-dienoyl-CoA reductase/sulfur reductase-like enzyme